MKTKFVIQKYNENPLLVLGRKFDIRVWVLVTDWNPLIVWMYKDPYIRFAANDFDLNDIENKYSHLSNNTVSAECEEDEKPTGSTSHDIPENMWTLLQFRSHL